MHSPSKVAPLTVFGSSLAIFCKSISHLRRFDSFPFFCRACKTNGHIRLSGRRFSFRLILQGWLKSGRIMDSQISKTKVFAFAQLSFLGWLLAGNVPVFSQPADSELMLTQLQITIKRLESSAAVDLDKSEAVFKFAMRDPAYRDLATCSMALIHLKRGNLEAVANFNRKTHELFPAPSLEKQSLLLRIQLSCDIATESEIVAESFSKMVQLALNDQLSKDSRLACAAMLGSITGMLEMDCAQPPIEREHLLAAKTSMLKLPDTEVAISFDASYRKAYLHATALADWLLAQQNRSLEDATNVAKEISDRLRVTSQERKQLVSRIRNETKRHRKAIFDCSNKKVAIQQEIELVLLQWNYHPEIHNPIKPDRRSFVVRTTEQVKVGSHRERVEKTRYNIRGVKETYSEYEEVDKYETRSRSQWDIDRDIDALYLPRLNQYLALKQAGQAFIDRKDFLEVQFRNADAGIQSANREIKELEGRGKEEQSNWKRLHLETNIANEAIAALKTGNPKSVFRPPNFNLIDYTLETKILLKRDLGRDGCSSGRAPQQ